jgi:hypothetical protein
MVEYWNQGYQKNGPVYEHLRGFCMLGDPPLEVSSLPESRRLKYSVRQNRPNAPADEKAEDQRDR